MNLQAGRPSLCRSACSVLAGEQQCSSGVSAITSGSGTTSHPSRLKVITAFLAIYVIWGSTYLAIRFGVETIPPFLMAGIRFVLAGSLLFFVELRRGSPLPTRAQWRSAAIIGGLLLLIGNGGVTWAELSIPSGVTALLIGTSPLWFVVLDWLLFNGGRPTRQTSLGLAVGLCGVVLLVGPDRILEGGGLSISGILVLMIATAAWAGGSLYSRRAPLPASPFMATAIEMLAGGGLLLVLSLILGEPFHVDSDSVTMKSVLALGYLFLFGSLVGFTAYVWLLRVSTPARVSTYAFVNPVIAVLLGWTLGGEEMTGRMLIAALIIVVGVVLIVVRKK